MDVALQVFGGSLNTLLSGSVEGEPAHTTSFFTIYRVWNVSYARNVLSNSYRRPGSANVQLLSDFEGATKHHKCLYASV